MSIEPRNVALAGACSTRLRQRGTALVEVMIVAPLLFLLMFGVAEFGQLIQRHEALIKTVRNAARHAATDPTGGLGVVLTTAVVRNTQRLTVYGNINGTGAPLLPGFQVADVSVTEPVALHIQVTANYTYQPFLGGAGLLNVAVPMTATTTMRSL